MKRWYRWASFLGLFSALHSLAIPVFAGAIKPVVTGFTLDGSIREWQTQPANLTLKPKSTGARTGRVWLAQTPQGLVIAGAVDGPVPRFAQNPEDMPQSDHVEVWIALTDEVPLPSIGWNDRFGSYRLTGAADCDDSDLGDHCRAWFAEQLKYRHRFTRLFVRQWQLAPEVAVETYARPAFAAMTGESQERLRQVVPQGWFEQVVDEALHRLLPRQLPEARFAKTFPEGYSFEILVPWEALPPADRLTLERVRLLVDVFSPGEAGRYGAFSTSSEARQYGRIDTMNSVTLTPPHRWRLARCGYPLETYAADPEIRNEHRPGKLPAYFQPTRNEQIDDIFVLKNQYIDFHTAPAGLSPIIQPSRLFSLELAPGVVACGPELAVRRGKVLTLGEGLRVRPGARAKKVPGGWLLASGPYEEMASMAGEGHCGACEERRLDMIFIPAGDGPPVSAFRAGGLVCECCFVGYCIDDIALADDFQTIQVMEGNDLDDSKATLRRFCFKASTHTFGECGMKRPPPNFH